MYGQLFSLISSLCRVLALKYFSVQFSKGGVYIFNIYDTYAVTGWCLLSIIFFESIAIAWIYGKLNIF
jgi:lipoprotein signal peptidase